MSLNTLKTIYYSYFNMTKVTGNSPHSVKIFRMQKKDNQNYDRL